MGHFLLHLKSQNIRQTGKKKKKNHISKRANKGGKMQFYSVLTTGLKSGETTARVSSSASSIYDNFLLLTTHYKTVLRIETKPQNFPIPMT